LSSFCTKKLQSQTVIREKLQKALLYNKGARKMLMKFTPGEVVLSFIETDCAKL